MGLKSRYHIHLFLAASFLLVFNFQACSEFSSSRYEESGNGGSYGGRPDAPLLDPNKVSYNTLAEEFSDDFLEDIDCGWLVTGQQLSVNPSSIPANQTLNVPASATRVTSYGERRYMAEMQQFVCLPKALLAAERALKIHKPVLPQAAFDLCEEKLRLARNTFLSHSLLDFTQGLVNLLRPTSILRQFVTTDYDQHWLKVGQGRDLVAEVFRILETHHIPALNELESPLRTYLTKRVGLEGQIGKPKDSLNNQMILWKTPLSETPVRISALMAVEKAERDMEKALLCAYEAAGDLCQQQTEKDVMTCISETGNKMGCADFIALKRHAKEVAREATQRFSLPVQPPYLSRIHSSLTFADLCVSAQRAHRARQVRLHQMIALGSTPEGFHLAMAAGLAHAQIHLERGLGQAMPLLVEADKGDPSNPAQNVAQEQFRSPYEIRRLVYGKVPGVVNGECQMGEDIKF